MPILRGRGWRPDTAEFTQKTAKFGLHHIGYSAEPLVPKSADVLSSHVIIRDQQNSEGCVGFGYATTIGARLRFLGYSPVPFAPQGIWTIARALARDDASAPLVNEGTYPYLAAFGIRTFGIPTEDEFPFDPFDLTKEIDVDTFGKASSFRLQAFSKISETEDRLVSVLKQLLAAGHPVNCGTFVGRKYVEWRPGKDPVGVEDGDPDGGGHFITLTGYEDDGDVFISPGSYGTNFGDNGFVRIAREKIVARSTSDFYNITITEK